MAGERSALLLGREHFKYTGSGAAAAPPALPALHVPRATLLAVVQRRQARAVACRSLPAALAMYALAMYTVVEHGRVADSYDLETALVDNVVWAGDAGFPESVYVPADYFNYLRE